MDGWPSLIRDVPDFPRPGIHFRDITPLLADADGFAAAIDAMAAPWRGVALGAVVGIEARGFILGAALARALGCGFVPVRKPGKLPGPVHSEAYALEYGEDRLEIRADALPAGTRALLVDDVLATGGTLAAAWALLRAQGALAIGASLLLEIPGLGGRDRLEGLALTVAASG